jgi:hypothetical protein
MPEYIFESGKELAVIRVDESRNLFIKDKLTNFQYLMLDERLYHDREKRNKFRLMKSKIPKLTQDELDVYLVLEMSKLGYKLRTKM